MKNENKFRKTVRRRMPSKNLGKKLRQKGGRKKKVKKKQENKKTRIIERVHVQKVNLETTSQQMSGPTERLSK